jgi:putative DNA primase/helicase
MNAEQVAHRIGQGREKFQSGQWKVLCPAHADQNPSLSIKDGADGRVVAICYAGCELDAILIQAGLEWTDLFNDSGSTFERDDSWVPGGGRMDGSPYSYTDETGKELFQVVRLIDRNGKKDFRQRRRDPSARSGWTWKIGDVRRPLHRLPEVISAIEHDSTIFVVEGEKDVESVRRAGAVATCNPHGANTWLPEHTETLRKADVVVVTDQDEPGRKHAWHVVKSLTGVASRVRMVQSLVGKDVTDHLTAGHSLEELALLDSIEANADSAKPAVQLPESPQSSAAPRHVDGIDVAGDHLNAERFLSTHGEHVRYSPELRRWFVWSGAWWHEDRTETVQEFATKTIDSLRSWVLEDPSPEEYQRRFRHYQASARSVRRDGLLTIARTDPGIVVEVEQLDTHPHLLAFRNGTVDLCTGALLPADPAHLITRGVDGDYDPTATSRDWEDFLSKIFGGESDLIAYVQRLLGYAITGEIGEHLLATFYGTGANGKTQLLTAVQALMGEHAAVAPAGLLTEQKYDQHPERLAALRGRRLVVSSELEHRAVLAEGLVKSITGGDPISARHLYGDRFEFSPSHTVVLVTNHLPQVRGTDEAIWRRIKVVPFEVTIPPSERIKDLGKRLARQDGQAIMAWLVQGAVRWYSEGVGDCEAVQRASSDYRQSEDTFSQFLTDCTVKIPGKTKLKELRQSWTNWAKEADIPVGRTQDFSNWLRAHDIKFKEYQHVQYAIGVGISAASDDPVRSGEFSSGDFPYEPLHEEVVGGELTRGHRDHETQVRQRDQEGLDDDPEDLLLLFETFPGTEVIERG